MQSKDLIQRAALTVDEALAAVRPPLATDDLEGMQRAHAALNRFELLGRPEASIPDFRDDVLQLMRKARGALDPDPSRTFGASPDMFERMLATGRSRLVSARRILEDAQREE
jgi:hypothetical protein